MPKTQEKALKRKRAAQNIVSWKISFTRNSCIRIQAFIIRYRCVSNQVGIFPLFKAFKLQSVKLFRVMFTIHIHMQVSFFLGVSSYFSRRCVCLWQNFLHYSHSHESFFVLLLPLFFFIFYLLWRKVSNECKINEYCVRLKILKNKFSATFP